MTRASSPFSSENSSLSFSWSLKLASELSLCSTARCNINQEQTKQAPKCLIGHLLFILSDHAGRHWNHSEAKPFEYNEVIILREERGGTDTLTNNHLRLLLGPSLDASSRSGNGLNTLKALWIIRNMTWAGSNSMSRDRLDWFMWEQRLFLTVGANQAGSIF